MNTNQLYLQKTGDDGFIEETGTLISATGGNVGIGTTTPSSYDVEGRNLVIAGTGAGVGLTIVSETGHRGNLYFADGSGGNLAFRGGVSYDHNVDDLSFRTAATERLWINNIGNVGIGTANPDAPLTIHNSGDPEIRFGYSSTEDHSIQWDSSKVHIHADPENANSSSALGLYVDGSPRLYINADGNIGIGTTAPNGPLEVLSGAAGHVDQLFLTNNNGAADDSAGLVFSQAPATHYYAGIRGIFTDVSADTEDAELAFYTSEAGTYAEKMRIDSAGKVGIGTIDPIGPLHVSNVSANTINLTREIDIIGIANGAASKLQGGALSGANPSMGAAIGFALVDSDGAGAGGNTHGYYYIETKDSGGILTEKMRITDGGKVGIGTNSPISNLHIAGDSADLYITNDSGDYTAVLGSTASHEGSLALYNSGATNILFRSESGAASYINNNGNVGIGNTAPSHNLTLGSATSSGTTNKRLKIYRGADDAGQNIEMGYNGITITRDTYTLADPQSSFDITQSGSDGERICFKIGSDGNVGIGTVSPDALLNVEGSGSDTDWTNTSSLAATAPSVLITNTTNTADTFSAMQMIANEGSNNQSFAIVNQATTAGAGDRGSYSPKVHFAQRTASNTFIAAVTIDEDANVGIGTDSPGSRLHVYGHGAASGIILGTDPSNANSASIVNPGNYIEDSSESRGLDLIASNHGTTDNGTFRFFTSHRASGEKMRITHDGNVGIGTTTPSGKLEIGGSGEGIVLTSPAGNKYLVTVGNGGALETQVL